MTQAYCLYCKKDKDVTYGLFCEKNPRHFVCASCKNGSGFLGLSQKSHCPVCKARLRA